MISSEHILFVFEGERTEKDFTRKFIKYYFSEPQGKVVTTAFCGEIYQLLEKMTDDFGLGSIDLFPLLQEIPQNKFLQNFKRDQFSQIYLFFDYDPHASTANDDKLREMLAFFDQETGNGKLFVSYPMVEATRCLHEDCSYDCFANLAVPLQYGQAFKGFSSDYASHTFRRVVSWSRQYWDEIIIRHCEKANFISTGQTGLPEKPIASQSIFEGQLRHIGGSGHIYVLSSFPVMFADYFGMAYIRGFARGIVIGNNCPHRTLLDSLAS
ncbi:hypothetical protein HU764_001515 [Pseudomonas sp. SWRI100]|uniref:hypothetical protein n=1 Tax=Pseudomonas TaxID=286 RepID=UPI0016445242|nr:MULTISPECIES: hypothetical protein [Pseudomonas]MBC3499497.1 hypothetical protein [Pseudomonas sp. SWRI67]MBV4524774.1 hypothetical protein [Pseudomonas kermanshahensis]